MKNTFLLTLIAFACASPAPAQNESPFAEQARQTYTSVKNNLIGAAEAMPEAKYSFRPVAEEMTFGQWVAHVATSQSRYCSLLAGKMPSAGDSSPLTARADLITALKASFDLCDQYYNALTDGNVLETVSIGQQKVSRGGILAYNIAHDNECYGSMAVYLRMNGITPPSTAARMAATGANGGRGAATGQSGR